MRTLHLVAWISFSALALANPILGTDPAIPVNLQLTTFATGLNYPYGLYQLPDGSILAATSSGPGLLSSGLQIVRITTTGGVANPPTVVFRGGGGPATGLTGVGNLVAVATGTNTGSQIDLLQAGPDGTLTQIGQATFAYPGIWEHDSHAIAMQAVAGQAGTYQLVFSVGSQYNQQTSTGTVGISGFANGTLQGDSVYSTTFSVSGSTVTPGVTRQIASGLRNPFALGFNSDGDVYIGENGQDLDPTFNTPASSDNFDIVPQGSPSVLNFGYPNTYIDPTTGAVIGNPSGITLPYVSFLPLASGRSQGVAGIALASSGFAPGLNSGVFFGFTGVSGSGGAANFINPVVYVDLSTGRYFDLIPPGQDGLGHPNSLLSTDGALYIADLTTSGGFSSPGTGVIYEVSLSAVPEPASWGLVLVSIGGLALFGIRRARVRLTNRSATCEP